MSQRRYLNTCFVCLLFVPFIAVSQAETADKLDATEAPPTFDSGELLTEQLRPFNVKADLENKVATLSGIVNNAVEKDLAEAIARNVEGVATVNSQIQIKSAIAEPARIKPPEQIKSASPIAEKDRSIGTWIQDFFISLKVKLKLLLDRGVSGFRIGVDTLEQVVTLTGKTSNADELRQAMALARDTSGVLEVRNMTDRKEKTPEKEVARSHETLSEKAVDTEEIINDGWITARIKSSFMSSDEVQAKNIDVDTTDGVVRLSGKVDNFKQNALAIRIAKNISGVKDVKSELQFPEEQ